MNDKEDPKPEGTTEVAKKMDGNDDPKLEENGVSAEGIDEEDDFEEFETQQGMMDPPQNIEEDRKEWNDEWDDEEAEDDLFEQKLRDEITKAAANNAKS